MAESQATESVLSPDELNSLVNDTVLYILHDEKCLNLIKRQDIVKYILKEKKKHFPTVIERVKTLLLETLNLELVAIDQNKQYALINRLRSTLFEVLRHLKILSSKQIKKHDYFGDVEAAIKKKYVRWAYLDYDVIPGTDPVEYEFKWGKRATEEISKKEILEFACKVNGDTEPAFWEKQYEEAMKQAAERST
ncbi:melanoma-associated antigen B18 isoform X2 [Hetaerina americana]|uniref:melanoma-associated antigen B18 isoform X2 n=1 Tax=Hetaerina americana TaxID=62018 RepID=UPI003A7F3C84